MHFFQMMRWILGCIHQDQELQLEHELLKPTEALSAEASDPAGAEKKLLWSISEIDYIIILHGKRIICYPSASHNQKSASSTLSLDLIARSLARWGLGRFQRGEATVSRCLDVACRASLTMLSRFASILRPCVPFPQS